eukprot:scaffold6076_cov154-Skeletonema_marinoi.AAC.2
MLHDASSVVRNHVVDNAGQKKEEDCSPLCPFVIQQRYRHPFPHPPPHVAPVPPVPLAADLLAAALLAATAAAAAAVYEIFSLAGVPAKAVYQRRPSDAAAFDQLDSLDLVLYRVVTKIMLLLLLLWQN